MTLALVAPVAAIAQTACQTGGDALANAFVRANPISAHYFGTLESYVSVNPGQQRTTPSQQIYGISMQLSRLARVLPPAASGNYQPLYTPTNELEQMQIFAAQMFQPLMQDPTMASVMAQIEPLAVEAAQLEYQIINQAAARLAQRTPNETGQCRI
jgi:hypothetical protein